jgi:hypothetical protein
MISLRSPWTAACFAIAVVISVVCLLATYLLQDLPQMPMRLKWLTYLFSLSFENNFGAWWSSMLLLTTSLLAFDAGLHARAGGDRPVAWGWGALALVMLILSIDEGASVHERVAMHVPIGTRPFGAVLILLMSFGLATLWCRRAYRVHTMWFVVAFMLLATVPVQEHLEVSGAQLGGSPGRRALLEEGTEIIAMLILLAVAARAALNPPVTRAEQDPRPFAWVDRYPRTALWCALAAAPFVAQFSAVLPDQNRGRIASWFAAAMALFAAFSLIRSMIQGRFVPRARELLLAGGAILLSLQVFTFDLVPTSGRRPVIALLFVGIALIYSVWPGRHENTLRRYGLPVAAAAFALFVLGSHKLVVLNLMVICATLAIWLAAAFPQSGAAVKWHLPMGKRTA